MKSPTFITYESVITIDNLTKSYHHVRKGKKKRAKTIYYHMNHLERLNKLKSRLDDGSYRIMRLNRFRVFEPKEREVIANEFEDKIVQDVISKYVLKPLLMPRLIFDNYASQPKKGTHKALERLQRYTLIHAKSVGWTDKGWVMVGDLSKFFYMIDHEVCWNLVKKLPMDNKLKKLVHDQIDACTEDLNPYTDKPGKGLCIGFQTSQWLAVYYLDQLDRFIKEKLKIKCYGRYMDDFYLIHESKEYLEYCFKEIKKFIENTLCMKMNDKSYIHPFKQGICFLGYHVTYNPGTHQVETEIRKKSINKMLKRSRRQKIMIATGSITRENAADSIQSWHAYACHGESEKAINAYEKAKMMLRLDDLYVEEYKQLCDSWDNVEPDGFYKLRVRKDGELRDQDGFMHLMAKKKSKRDVWDEEHRQVVLEDIDGWAKKNYKALLTFDPYDTRPRKVSKKTKAKRKLRDSQMSLMKP